MALGRLWCVWVPCDGLEADGPWSGEGGLSYGHLSRPREELPSACGAAHQTGQQCGGTSSQKPQERCDDALHNTTSLSASTTLPPRTIRPYMINIRSVSRSVRMSAGRVTM